MNIQPFCRAPSNEAIIPCGFSRSVLALALGLAVLAPPAVSFAQVAVGLTVTLAPPPLPVYEQPPIPAPGYLWTPGYWAYGPEGYYWVPGTWVEPPQPGLYWTPAWWGWNDGRYLWHQGYWGPEVGFYGGINLGYGYVGNGYEGGRWDHGHFAYNRAANNIGTVHVTNVYNQSFDNHFSHVSYNGGPGGIQARPTARQEAFERQHHIAPTAMQMQHIHAASANHALLATVNHGHPAILATRRPGVFNAPGGAHGAAPRQGRAATPLAQGHAAPAHAHTTVMRHPAHAAHDQARMPRQMERHTQMQSHPQMQQHASPREMPQHAHGAPHGHGGGGGGEKRRPPG